MAPLFDRHFCHFCSEITLLPSSSRPDRQQHGDVEMSCNSSTVAVECKATAVELHDPHCTHHEVMRAGLSGDLMPAKTSRHVLADMPHGANIPLAILKEK
jgi:hypothetical protein